MYTQEEIKAAILAADVLKSGHFIFADGGHAQIKLEMDNLWDHPEELSIILGALAGANGLPRADVILGVPTGGQRLALELVDRKLLDVPIARLERVPGGAKQDFRFCSQEDELLARTAKNIRIYEDVVTTLSSVAGVVRLLDPTTQDIHSLAIWRRGKLKEDYLAGVTPHFLVEEELPVFTKEQCSICTT
jgi:orotate phosphoribosyltransferase